jgi:hypothetical protein
MFSIFTSRPDGNCLVNTVHDFDYERSSEVTLSARSRLKYTTGILAAPVWWRGLGRFFETHSHDPIRLSL